MSKGVAVLDGTAKLDFVREGLKRYPDARGVVDYFQSSILDALTAAFEERSAWTHFQPLLRDGRLDMGKSIGPTDRFIQAWIVGTIGNIPMKTFLGLGLWWSPPRQPGVHVVAACHATNEKGVQLPMQDVPSRSKSVKLGPLQRRTESRLFIPLADDFEPKETFSLLLESADEALGVVAQGGGQRIAPAD
jgi:hypothetical protein